MRLPLPGRGDLHGDHRQDLGDDCRGGMVRLRFSEINPGQVTGYAVGLPGHDGSDGKPFWYGGGRLSAGLTLPWLRRRWDPVRSSAPERISAPERSGAFRFTAPERNAIYEHAARQADAAADHIRRCAAGVPARAADAAWAAADTLHVAARALGNPMLRWAADSYDRAARAQYGRIPQPTREGSQLRAAAWLMALTGRIPRGASLATVALIANLVALAVAVAELREAQRHAAQASAARAAASHLHAWVPGGSPAGRAEGRRVGRTATAAEVARGDFLMSARPGRSAAAGPGRAGARLPRESLPPRRAGPAP